MSHLSKNTAIVGIIVILIIVVGFWYVNNQSRKQQPKEGTTTTVVSTPPPANATKTEATTGSTAMVAKEFIVQSNGLNFTPNQLRVKVGDKLKVTYQNNKGTHTFTIDELKVKTKLLNAGQKETVEFVADKAGSFEYYCSVPGHKDAGMKGTLIVE